MKVLHATFIHPTELPGKAMATHANAFNPEQPQRGGFELDLVEIMGSDYLRIAVPWAAFLQNRGAWFDQHDGKRQPLHGLGRVCHVPRELCKKLEFIDDMMNDMDRLAAERAPKKKSA